MQHKKRVWVLLSLFSLSLLYVCCFMMLRRHALQYQEENRLPGVFFSTPIKNSDWWRFKNYGLIIVFYPAIVANNMLSGDVLAVAHEPLWELN